MPETAPETVTEPIYIPTVEQIIRDAASRYGLSGDRLLQMAYCESTINQFAVNYGYYENGYPSGLFQHLSGYFSSRAARYGYSTDVFDAYANANVTAAMIADGQANQWACSY